MDFLVFIGDLIGSSLLVQENCDNRTNFALVTEYKKEDLFILGVVGRSQNLVGLIKLGLYNSSKLTQLSF